MDKKIAVIDLGSNSVRVIVMGIYADLAYQLIDQAKEMVRLSEAMGPENTLKPGAMHRAIGALKLFKQLIETHKVDAVYAVATAAVRNARNKELFLAKVKAETGFTFQVLSGEEEAFFDYLGVINSIPIDNCVIVDIGGASTELAWVENRTLKAAVSIPYGAVILTDQFLNTELISPEKLAALEAFILNQLQGINWLTKVRELPVVGLGGSIRTLGRMDKRQKKFPLEGLHNYQMSFPEVAQACDQAITAGLEERKKIPGLNKDRADIIPAGLVLIKQVMNYLGAEQLIISGNGLREGVFFQNYLQAIEFKGELIPDILTFSVENILKKYAVNIRHSYHVQKLALALFDQTRELHALGEAERKLLSVGALLHDIGVCIDYYNHHKHGFYLVLNSRIYGLTNRELVMCAFIVALHEKDELKQAWKGFSLLVNDRDLEIVGKLSLFVRIAQQLDRVDFGAIEDIQCTFKQTGLEVRLKTGNKPQIEAAESQKIQKLFKKLVKRGRS